MIKVIWAAFGSSRIIRNRNRKTEQTAVRIMDWMIQHSAMPAYRSRKNVKSAKRFTCRAIRPLRVI